MSAPVESTDEGRAGLRGARVAVIGCGAVGSALAHGLARAGVHLSLASRTRASADRLLATLRAAGAPNARVGGVGADFGAALFDAEHAPELVLLTVGDGALASVAEALAGAGGGSDDTHAATRTVLHTNGTSGLEVLEPLARRGWATGKLHPLVALPPVHAGDVASPQAERIADRFNGAWFATLGSPRAEAWTGRVLDALGARALPLAAHGDASVALHAAAALLSGGVVALLASALDAAKSASDDSEATSEALASLLAGSVANAAELGARDALTGPIARGSVDLVRRHLEALASSPDAARAYRVLGRRMLALVRGSVSRTAHDEIEALLSD